MNIGDYVLVRKCTDNPCCVGKIAKIIQEDITLGLEFEEFIGGHDCNFRGRDGYCWYMSERNCIPPNSIAYLLHERGENSS